MTDVIQPGKAATAKAQRDTLKQNVQTATLTAQEKPFNQSGAYQPGQMNQGLAALGTLGVLQKAGTAGAQLFQKQGTEQDALNLQGANLQQDIAGAKTKQAVINTKAGLENETQTYARLVADKMFQSGMQAKQLVFSANNALADYSFTALKKDFEAGRVSQKEVRDLTNQFTIDAEKKKQIADQALRKAQDDFEFDMKEGNTARAKSRILSGYAAAKEALEAAAKAQASASILSGVVDIASTVAGVAYGPGAAAGVKVAGGIVKSQV